MVNVRGLKQEQTKKGKQNTCQVSLLPEYLSRLKRVLQHDSPETISTCTHPPTDMHTPAALTTALSSCCGAPHRRQVVGPAEPEERREEFAAAADAQEDAHQDAVDCVAYRRRGRRC